MIIDVINENNLCHESLIEIFSCLYLDQFNILYHLSQNSSVILVNLTTLDFFVVFSFIISKKANKTNYTIFRFILLIEMRCVFALLNSEKATVHSSLVYLHFKVDILYR